MYGIGDKFIGKNIFQNLLMVQSKSELRFTYKVTDHHLNVHGAQRQKVKTAVQLFSRTVSKAIQYYADKNLAKPLNWKEVYLLLLTQISNTNLILNFFRFSVLK